MKKLKPSAGENLTPLSVTCSTASRTSIMTLTCIGPHTYLWQLLVTFRYAQLVLRKPWVMPHVPAELQPVQPDFSQKQNIFLWQINHCPFDANYMYIRWQVFHTPSHIRLTRKLILTMPVICASGKTSSINLNTVVSNRKKKLCAVIQLKRTAERGRYVLPPH